MDKISAAFLIVGLSTALIGALRAGWPALITRAQAAKIGTPVYAHDDMDKNADLPMPQALMAQSRAMKHGMALIAVGTALQIIGTVIPLFK